MTSSILGEQYLPGQDPYEYFKNHSNRFAVLDVLGSRAYDPGMTLVEHNESPAIRTRLGEVIQEGKTVVEGFQEVSEVKADRAPSPTLWSRARSAFSRVFE